MTALSAVVVFCTTYALILPAITLEKNTYCGLEEHEHTDDCYTQELICGQEEGEGAHTHTAECYDEEHNLICGLEENEGHVHTEECYGEPVLICVLEEHTHTEECYIDPDAETEDAEDEEDTDKLISALDLDDAEESGNETYQTVSSFYLWLHTIGRDGTTTTVYSNPTWVEENKAFDSNGIDNALTYTDADGTWYLIPVSYFVEAYEDYGYTFDPDYISACPFTYAPNAYNSTKNLTQASYIQVNDQWYVQIEDTTGLLPARSNIYYYLPTSYSVVTNTVNHPGSVINLFDYWIEAQGAVDVGVNDADAGVNADHALKFSYNTKNYPGTADQHSWNVWTGSSTLYQGIVAKTLGADGYPILSGDETVFVDGPNDWDFGESLAYLFDPTIMRDYKETHRNVSGLLQVDEQGYYYYDSSENYAEYDAETNSFTLYDTWGVKTGGYSPNGQFFPFNSMEEVADVVSIDPSINHYFGLTLTTRFYQQYDGYTNASRKTETVFNFAGDDDVWIFIDDVLVADLGGIHDRASVSINFATGEVNINVDENGKPSDQSTTLKAAFEAAGKTPVGGWQETDNNGCIFADGTYHTLKFYYMERGNTDSNLYLQYNLSSYPETGIYKVDQYGKAVEGATFAVYAANDKYQMLSDLSAKGGQVGPLPDAYTYDLNPDSSTYGSIMNDDKVAVKALYTGATDEKGEMIFVDEDLMPYTLTELESMFGDHFILREIAVPEGYRQVSDDVHLKILNHRIMLCDNTYESGIYTQPNLQVAAPNTIMLANKVAGLNEDYVRSAKAADGNDRTIIDYYDENGNVNGTVFAVVLKYTGTGADGLSHEANWSPVYGTDEQGFTVVDVNSDNFSGDFISAAIWTARQYVESKNVFAFADGGQMQGSLNGMPGDISTYYYMLDEDNKGDTQYTVAYYWTSADSLKDATSSNTYRVNADKDTAGAAYEFKRSFGATIEVPNLLNRLFVQKFDEDGSLLNGAKFAMYDVQEAKDDEISGNATTIYYIAENGTLIYLEPDTDGDNQGAAQIQNGGTGTYTVDSNTGVITVTVDSNTYTIKPGEYAIEGGGVAATVSSKDVNNPSGEDGTATFTNMRPDTYYVREIAAPPGYAINPTEVMVLVDESAVYANAGTVDDGVTVARGPGYVVSTLNQFASQGDIDNTLSWIYEMMRVSGVSTTFDDSDFLNNTGYQSWGYLIENGNGANLTTETDQHSADGALRTYLEYAADSENTLFNYTLNKERNADAQRRMYTNVGWSYYEIYQDWRWALGYGDGIQSHKKDGANYTILTKGGTQNGDLLEIANLFSRSTYIQVTDTKVSGDLEISKTVVNDENAPADSGEFKFTVTLTDAEGKALTGSYKYTVYDVDEDGKRTAAMGNEEEITGTISGGPQTITLTDKQLVVIEDLPAGTQYTITETGNEEFTTTAEEKVLKAPTDSDDGERSGEGEETPYDWSTYSFGMDVEERTVKGTLYWYVDEKGSVDALSVVNYTNTYLPDLTILKVDESTQKALEGAKFVFCKTVTDEGDDGESKETKYYYNNDGKWVERSEGEDAVTQTTGTDGKITYLNIPDGTYCLEEVKAPDGYNLLTDKITVMVSGGVITAASMGGTPYKNDGEGMWLTLTVPNSSGYTLPNTGGAGIQMYTWAGMLLMLGGAAGLLYRHQKLRGKEENS